MTIPAPTHSRGRFRLSLATRLGLGFGLIAIVLWLGHDAALRDMRDAIETLRETQTEQVPLSRIADALTYHVVAFDRAVLTEVRAPTDASRASVSAAEAALFASLDSYAGLQPNASGEIAHFRAEAQEHTRLGWSLIDIGAKRYHALNGIRIMLVDFWSKGAKYQRLMLWIILGIWFVVMIPGVYFMLQRTVLNMFGSGS